MLLHDKELIMLLMWSLYIDLAVSVFVNCSNVSLSQKYIHKYIDVN